MRKVGRCVTLTRIPSSLRPIVSLFKPRKAYIKAVRTFALYAGRTTKEVGWISAMERFQRNPHNFFDFRCPFST